MCTSDSRTATGDQCHPETMTLGGDSPIRMVRIEAPLNVRVHCVTGMLWITQLGDLNDYILGPRESKDFGGKETVVINPVKFSVCSIVSTAASSLTIRMDGHTAVVRSASFGFANRPFRFCFRESP